MKSSDVTIYRDPQVRAALSQIAESDYDLDAIETEVLCLRLERIATRLRAAGFGARTEGPEGITFRYVCVYPSDDGPGEWATVDEAQRLLDTVHNLPAAEAFARWRTKIDGFEQQSYTRSDAVRDTRAARAELAQQFAAGKMSSAEYKLAYEQSSFMDLAK